MVEKVCFVGAGSMAESIIAGILKSQFISCSQVYVTNKSVQARLTRLQEQYGVHVTTDKAIAIRQADMVILATKPYDIADAIDAIRSYIEPGQLIVSVVAGKSTSFIEKRIDKPVPVIRAMPNTSAAIGFSATAVTAGSYADEDNLKIAVELFETIGLATVVEEQDMHMVTSISGSGPAYIYYLAEAMEMAAVQAGFDRDMAKSLIIQTVLGAGMMLKNTGVPAEELRRKITSPNGTTQAGIEALQANHFQEIVGKCVDAARARSVELGIEN